MKKSLIIVESPTKIKTLKKFVGSQFDLISSVGHIRDLPEREFGIDLEHEFTPLYTILEGKEKVVKDLQKAARESDIVYLSPDPDREGESIAWHITKILPPGTKYKRVTFNSITKEAVLKALKEPRDIDLNLVNAQQARRLLDRIVGYKLSPFLNRRIQGQRKANLSAGRVQSVALKLVVEREKEIARFIPIEFWRLFAFLAHDGSTIRALLYSVDEKRIEKEPTSPTSLVIGTEQEATKVLSRMRKTPYIVQEIVRKEKRRSPFPPFITSTLQQEASRHFGFSSTKTMQIAQTLYEGVDLGKEGSEGLITYMRTDSVRVAPEAIGAVRALIEKVYGREFLPEKSHEYASKKSAQDAHEAIRPTHLHFSPSLVKPHLTSDQFRLYQLIWQRFVASQMAQAIFDTVSVDIANSDHIIVRATGSTPKFQGFLAVYEERRDEEEESDEAQLLPTLKVGEVLKLLDVKSEQSFTKPPPRFTEASLVKELEKSGIGRPSTYAAIMNKIQARDYTTKENKRLKPTELGLVISDFLEANFKQIMDVGFTAAMEDELEKVAENKKEWKDLLKEFWSAFSPMLDQAEKEGFVPKQLTDLPCPKCHAPLQKIWFKSKYFYGCSRYPECDYSAPIAEIAFNKEDYSEDFDWDQKCPLCSSAMKVRHGRFGAFLGCTNYPKCKGIVNIPKKGEKQEEKNENAPPCPAIGCEGKIIAKRSRFGKGCIGDNNPLVGRIL